MVTRVLYQDIKPYAVPSSLAALRGPEHGLLKLPFAVYWGPNPVVDLDTLSGVMKAYQPILREARSELQQQLLNRHILVRYWDELILPTRVRDLWESTFPELRR